MKAIAALFLIFLLAFPTLWNNATWFSFWVKQAEIIALFCENKAKPELQCNGKCHLAKTLKEQVPQSKDNSTLQHVESLPYIFLKWAYFFRPQAITSSKGVASYSGHLISFIGLVESPPPQKFKV